MIWDRNRIVPCSVDCSSTTAFHLRSFYSLSVGIAVVRDWHINETYIRVGGKWRYLWGTIDQRGCMIDVRLTTKHDTMRRRHGLFLKQSLDWAGLYQPLIIFADKAPTYGKVIAEINSRLGLDDAIVHVDRKWKNNRIESDHASLKQIANLGKGFQTLLSTKAMLKGIDAVRTIKHGHVLDKPSDIKGEIRFVTKFFETASSLKTRAQTKHDCHELMQRSEQTNSMLPLVTPRPIRKH